MSYEALPYYSDSTELFSIIRKMPYACWLDSGKPSSHSGRYDIISAMPALRIVTEGYLTQHYQHTQHSKYSQQSINSFDEFCSNHDYQKREASTENPFELIKKALASLRQHNSNNDNREQNPKVNPAPNPVPEEQLPFWGGAIGYFGYDLSRRDYPIKNQTDERCNLPDMAVGIYHWAIIQDHALKTCWLASLKTCDNELITQIKDQVNLLKANKSHQETQATFTVGALSSNTPQNEYTEKLHIIDDYIHAGDCYQVNFSQCFSASYQGDPYSAYKRLRKAMPSPFSAYIDLGEKAILSLSPERFLQTTANKVLTQPIKGTMARGRTIKEDRQNAEILSNSEKNKAENVMIVDLLRNDLGKNCIPGSIKVPKLFSLESFSNVHHLVSSVTGTMKDDKTAIDVFRDAFPGGSITGAPKKRSMEIIEELENYRRSIYCGSISYININGDIDSNIAIRTIACDGDKLYCWGGGGIVADSDIDEEYQESLTKIGSLLEVLETFKDK